jgi:four helix bundle protein
MLSVEGGRKRGREMSGSVETKGPPSKRNKFDLEERLIDFAVRVIAVVEALPATRAGNHVANQLVRCGTSPAPNYAEAQGAESRNDFIHKLKVCLKELRETRVWLLIIQRKPLIKPSEKLMPLIAEGMSSFRSSWPASQQARRTGRKKRFVYEVGRFKQSLTKR